MKPISDQDHSEVLEISHDASAEEIERAYRLARATYADESLAGYSVFGEGEAAAVRQRIETAYRVLSNDESRQVFAASSSAAPVPAATPPVLPAARGLDELEASDEETSDFDGPKLRWSRMRRGIEIEEIAGVTKINPTYLRLLEEEEFRDLPAPVYVRGFVTAFARCVGLDPARFVPAYMQRLDAVQVSSSQGWRGRN